MSIKIYSMAEMQRLLREGGFPMEAPAINSPVLSGTLVGTYNIGGTPTVTQPVAFGGSGRLNLGGAVVDSPALQGDNDSGVLPDANQTITSASAWDLIQTPTATRTVKFDNSFGLGASRRLTNASTADIIILTANDDSEIGRLQPGGTTTLKAISASPAGDGDWSVLGPGAWTAVFAYRSGSNQSISTSDEDKIEINAKDLDHCNEFDESVNFRWTPLQMGVYIVHLGVLADAISTAMGVIKIKKNGSDYVAVSNLCLSGGSGTAEEAAYGNVYAVVEMNGVSDYIEFHVQSLGDASYLIRPDSQDGDSPATYVSISRYK